MSVKLVRCCHVLALCAVFVVPIVRLDSDPSPLQDAVGEINDEGFWNHNARCKVCFGTFVPDEFNQGLIASPLFTAMQWLTFSLCGVSIFSARLTCVISLWLVLLMVYVLMRRLHSPGAALLAVAALGLMHEMLMYAKWSSPILPQMMFLTAILFFWELGRRGSPWWMVASGACLPAAAATSLVTVYFLPSLAIYLAASLWLRKDVSRTKVVVFAASVVAFGAIAGAWYLINWEHFQFFMQNIGKRNFVQHPRSIGQMVREGLRALAVQPFVYPGPVILVMLCSLWGLQTAVRAARQGFRRAMGELSSVDLYALCWLVGCSAVVAVSPDKAAHRLVMLFIPMTLLAVSFAAATFRGRGGEDATRSAAAGVTTLSWVWRALLWIAISLFWSVYGWRTLDLVNECLAFAGRRIPAVSYPLVVIGCVTVAAIYFLFLKTRWATAILWGLFFTASLALDAIWTAGATFTIRDASRALADNTTPGAYFTGACSHMLSLENKLLPLMRPVVRNGPMNAWFFDHPEKFDFVLSLPITVNETPVWWVDPIQKSLTPFRPQRVTLVKKLALCPDVFAGNHCRTRIEVYRVRAAQPSASPGRPPRDSAARVGGAP
jgi:4-amino-4-deoxy-L-arabinose transferase-like glycosyltransferase